MLALAGIFQACSLVRQIAHDGHPLPEPYTASISSLFRIDAESTADVYGGLDGLHHGLKVVCDQLDKGTGRRDMELTRYGISLLFLERKLSRRNDLLQKISDGIQLANAQADYFSVTHTNVIARLADIYSNTVSTLSPRIMVGGDPRLLNDADNANRIRALLLSGVRSAVLWRQLGGNRLRLLFGRTRVVASARRMLAEPRG